MGRISSSIGLITGFPIQETVDKLIALQARPRDALLQINKKLEVQKTAVTQLTALMIGVQFAARKLSLETLYSQRTVSSSDESALTASVTGDPQLGSYQFTPLQLAQNHQLRSSRLASRTAPLGAGTLSFRFGGFVDQGLDLSLANGGLGIERGKIRITDRSGASAEIDLSAARNIDDVLRAINQNATIDVSAEVVGDHIRLNDLTGAATSNLKVQEVGGTTASSLGLAGIDLAASSAEGDDIVALFGELNLDLLNDGNGVRISDALADFKVTLRDGSEVVVDLRKLAVAGTKVTATTTAQNGVNAQLKFTAVQAGAAYDDVAISFVDDAAITAGEETVSYDAQAKTLVFRIDHGNTTANDIEAALARDTLTSETFSAEALGNGTGLVTTSDTAVTAGPQATATTPGGAGSNKQIVFTAVQGGSQFDDIEIRFEDNAGVNAGEETVAFDGEHLVFQIDAGNTTANHVIAALAANPAVNSIFTAANLAGSNGTGVVSTSDTVFTAGGAIVEPVPAGDETTLADVLATINAVAPTKLRAEIAPDGDRLLLTDLTGGAGTLAVTALNGSHAAADLGLTAAAVGDLLPGKRILGGLKSALLRSLDGGAGIENLGLIHLVDRNGGDATIDLAAAETLSDVIEMINAAGIKLRAQFNRARNGIEVVDTSGGVGNLLIENGDLTTDTADRLQLTVDAATSAKSSGTLRRAVVNENTALASLNGGRGVAAGSLTIFDSRGDSKTLTVGDDLQTVGNLLERIADLGLGIEARVNDAGDGILLIDTGGGSQTLRVEAGAGSTARDLHLLGEVQTLNIDGQDRTVIDGSTTLTVELDADDTLDDLVSKVEALQGGVRAAVLNDGSLVNPYRLTLTSQATGLVGALLVDTSQVGFTLDETVAAQDALLLAGTAGASGLLASSSTNTFREVLDGVSLSLKAATGDPVTVAVETTDESLVSTVQGLVDAYNRLRDKLDELTEFDEESGQSAVLQGDGAALRVESDAANLFTSRLFSVGPFQSLQALGVRVQDDGRLELDAAQLQARFAENPSAVADFLSKDELGLADRVDKLAEQLAGVGGSLLVNRVESLDRKLSTNSDRVEFLNARLEAARQRLLARFQRSETIIARIQANLSAIASLAPLTPLSLNNES